MYVALQCSHIPFSATMFLKNILDTIVVSVDRIGVIPWCLIWWFIWFVVFKFYKNIFLLFLKRISIQEEHRKHLVNLYWSIAFTAITVPFTLQNLNLTFTDILNKFYYVLENDISSWVSNDSIPSVHIKLSYVILSGYLLNNNYEICITKGLYSAEFIKNELLTLFFISTFPLRSVQFGFAFISINNVVEFFLCISKLFSCFCDISQTKSMRFLVHLFLLLHGATWVTVFFDILPRYFLFSSFKNMGHISDTKYPSMYILMNVSLICHFFFSLAKGTVTEILCDYISHHLPSKPTLDKNENVTNKSNEEIEIEFERNRVNKKKENLLKLYQTIKCAIYIKRKLKKIRSRREAENCQSVVSELDDKGVVDSTMETETQLDEPMYN